MRCNPDSFQIHRLKTLPEVLKKIKESLGSIRPFAGGTDLMVLYEAGKLKTHEFVDLSPLSELKGIVVESNFVRLGALTTYTQIQNHPLMQTEFPILVSAAKETGALAIQNRGTLGGNIANASPAADSLPGLLVYEAVLEVGSDTVKREIPYLEFHEGYKKSKLAPEELILSIRIPRVTKASSRSSQTIHRQIFRKVGTRKAQAISKVSFAGWIEYSKSGNSIQVGQARFAFGAVAPTPVRCAAIEKTIQGQILTPEKIDQAIGLLSQCIAPIDDIRSTARYRKIVAENLLREFLSEL